MIRQGAAFLFVSLLLLRPSLGESPACHAVYRDGGAHAVLSSPRCPRWHHLYPSSEGAAGFGDDSFPPPSAECHVAVALGMRRSQEDRAICALGIRIPFLEGKRVKEVDVGIIAVFDGHNGVEASDMASKLLLDYFLLHVYFLLDGLYTAFLKRDSQRIFGDAENIIQEVLKLNDDGYLHFRDRLLSPALFDELFFKEILKESLLRTIRDVDLTFSKKALHKNLEAGSTATVVLVVDGQVLAANVGDSKAFLCSKDANDQHEKGYHVKELTNDHHPDREDERRRVEGSGGYVVEWAGVPRVNGELAISRAIGDMPYRQYGVISIPELTGWHILSPNDSFLVAVSDGAIEKMTMQDICDLLYHEFILNENQRTFEPVANRLADVIVQSAVERGTFDNVAAVVVPISINNIAVDSRGHLEDNAYLTHVGQPSVPCLYKYAREATDGSSTSIIEMEYYNHLSSKLRKVLVQAKTEDLSCYYLSENLNQDMDYIFLSPLNFKEDDMTDIYQPTSGNGTLGIYKEHNFCWYFGLHDNEKDQCTSFDYFAKYLGLLDSSSHNSSTSSGYKIPDFRYKLKKRFDRGSYGEVWMAYRWNCSEVEDLKSNCSYMNTRTDFESENCNGAAFSGQNCSADLKEWDKFILKRIMVERGNAAYLSGLREKYYGELFLNATNTLGGLETADFSVLSQSDDHTSSSWRQKHSSSYGEPGLIHIARFVESFETNSKEIWLVFKNEGISLSKLIYTARETNVHSGDDRNGKSGHIQLLHPSAWWYWLRTTKAGQTQMQNLVRQLLMALKACHDRNITHRDIKPENMIVCFQDLKSGQCSNDHQKDAQEYKANLRIIDFGSAIDDFTMKNLYGPGPTRSEQTFEYTPPEALLNATWFHAPKSLQLKYDIWSVGVVMLELILGSPHVFQISDRSRALLDQHLDGWSEHAKELAYKLKSYMELCILVPGVASNRHTSSSVDQSNFHLASWRCSEESFAYQIKTRDPLKLGFTDIWALRLIRQLLVWHPEDRLSADEALNHPYFQQ